MRSEVGLGNPLYRSGLLKCSEAGQIVIADKLRSFVASGAPQDDRSVKCNEMRTEMAVSAMKAA